MKSTGTIKKPQYLLAVGTNDANVRDDFRKKIRLASALMDVNQDVVLIEAVDDLLKKLRTKKT